MRKRDYGQFCGLARAAETLGQRWTLLILRDLLVGPARYSDLLRGLPGIPTNVLSTRLKELEEDGIIVRTARRGSDRSVVYHVTQRGAELEPVLDALARWGAADMDAPREGEVVTDRSLASALRASARSTASGRVNYTVRVAGAVAHASVHDGIVDVDAGEHAHPDLTITGDSRLRDVLAGKLGPDAARASGAVSIQGDPALLREFADTFALPYSTDE